MGLQRNELPGNDQFTQYTEAVAEPLPVSNDYHIYYWWENAPFPQVRQLAFDTFSVPEMSPECERIFSSWKKLITAEHNKLGDGIIEATECLKAWWDAGLLEMPEVVEPSPSTLAGVRLLRYRRRVGFLLFLPSSSLPPPSFGGAVKDTRESTARGGCIASTVAESVRLFGKEGWKSETCVSIQL